jgi:hypothetical protein
MGVQLHVILFFVFDFELELLSTINIGFILMI